MSDLISRSEVNDVIDELEVYTCGRPNTMKVEISVLQLQRFINKLKNIPTAYDIGKIVAELEKLQTYNMSLVTLMSDLQKNGVCRHYICLEDAIEIVKQGCASDDDVCEWEKGQSGYVGYPAYYSKCCTTNSNGLEMQTHIIADWKYCPYCGKKIKVVE